MKKLMSLLFLFLLCFGNTEAQNRRAALQVRLQTNQAITVAVDGRYFRRFGNVLTIGDLPPGRHELKVYRYFPVDDSRYRPFARNTAHARLVYKGRISIAPSRMYYCLVDPDYGTMKVRESGMVALDGNEKNYPVATDPVFSDGAQSSSTSAPGQQEGSNAEDNSVIAYDKGNMLQQQQLNQLQQNVSRKITDTDKLKLIKESLANTALSTQQLAAMLGWLTFEDSRLDLAKWSYASIVDKNRFIDGIQQQFNYDSSLQELKDLAR